MFKRLTDILLAALIIISGLPVIFLILLIVLLIMRESPLLFQSRKVTLNKNEIKIIKIRTIRSSEKFIELENKSPDIFLKKELEQYVPPFCRWLRKTGIDEIPQLINVLKGEMSIVGPRPFPVHDLKLLMKSSPAFYRRRTLINSKPGITGYWQVYGNRQQGVANLIECEEIYERRKSILIDLRIIFRTFLILISAKHSDAIIQTVSGNRMSKLSGEIHAEIS